MLCIEFQKLIEYEFIKVIANKVIKYSSTLNF